MILRSAAEEHKTTTVTTVGSDHLPWSRADPSQQREERPLRMDGRCGGSDWSPTPSHSGNTWPFQLGNLRRVSWRDSLPWCRQGTGTSTGCRFPGYPRAWNSREGRQYYFWAWRSKARSTLESGEREVTAAVAFGREVPPTPGDDMMGRARGVDSSRWNVLPFSDLLSLFVINWMPLNPGDGEPPEAVHRGQPPRASGGGERMENGFGGACGRYSAQGETLDLLPNISESNILIFNLEKECASHRGVVKKWSSSLSVIPRHSVHVSLSPEGAQ